MLRALVLGAPPKLTVKHKLIILDWLKQPATSFGFETPLWTCRLVQQLINQKPERRALQANDNEARKWLKVTWPEIKAHARRWQAMLYFQDEAGVSLTAVLGKKRAQ